jgi:hypothetical protein
LVAYRGASTVEKLAVDDEYNLTATSAPEFGVVVLNQIDPVAASCFCSLPFWSVCVC